MADDSMRRPAHDVEFENEAVLIAVQAHLSLIGDGVIAAFVEAVRPSIKVHYVVSEVTESITEDISDAIFEMEAQSDGSIEFQSVVHGSGSVPQGWAQMGWRPFYWVKDRA